MKNTPTTIHNRTHKTVSQSPSGESTPVITIRIVQSETTPTQKTAWRKFWQKLIAEVKVDERQ